MKKYSYLKKMKLTALEPVDNLEDSLAIFFDFQEFNEWVGAHIAHNKATVVRLSPYDLARAYKDISTSKGYPHEIGEQAPWQVTGNDNLSALRRAYKRVKKNTHPQARVLEYTQDH